ncbi:Protein of unknown function [Thermomonospora echinospora]|uniref:DUF742 domain-containing protein n=1 Tax=Thermomonospora echinospora TaxID=1992 RepID=A0A1H6DSG3_9ACTN|nr:DUF742 domain-containing protein [Thermomonospora echinospora]SEG88004.1 Protein of unknown function [Thermomonospora echinospora]
MTSPGGAPRTGGTPGEAPRQPVRAYVMTRGRSQPSRNTLRPETLLIVTDPDRRPPPSATREERAFLDICRGLLSLAEAAQALHQPISVAAVLASDLIDAGHLTVRARPAAQPASPSSPDHHLLRALLDGLQQL